MREEIYLAIRNALTNTNVGDAVENAIRGLNLSFYAERVMQEAVEAELEKKRPCVLFRPRIFMDGNQWCALYGDDLQSGVAGFGDSPKEAMYQFDKEWERKVTK